MTLFAINPFRIHMNTRYNPPVGKKWGIIKYGNGFTFRLNKLAWHFTKLGPNDYSN